MNGFTSGKRDTLGLPPANHDEKPIVRPSDGQRGDFWMRPNLAPGEHGPFGIVEQMVYDPRPEFDVPDNPILAWVRFAERPEYVLAALDAYDAFGGYSYWDNDYVIMTATDEQRNHARRVLSKLAAIA